MSEDAGEYTCGNCGGQFRADKRTSCACHTPPAERPTPITDARAFVANGSEEEKVVPLHVARDLERQLAEALAHLRIADELRALERGALAAALQERDEARAEIERLNDLLEKIVCRYAEQEEQP